MMKKHGQQTHMQTPPNAKARKSLRQRFPSRFMEFVYEFGALILGSLLYGAGMNMFLTPGNIILGGVTGISTTVNYLIGTPIGLGIIVINLPLVLINARVFGFRSLTKTIIGILISSIAVDTLTMLPVTLTDPLLCALFGGVVMGAGAGIMLSRGYNTGGSDLSALLLKRKFKRLSTGRLIMIVDLFVVVGSAVITRRPDGVFYSLIAIFSYMALLDAVMNGFERAKLAYIISSKHEVIAEAITRDMQRGVTVLYGRGAYTKSEKQVLMCVVKRHQVFELKTMVHALDPEAFLILSDASEVLGSGFKSDI